MKKIWKFLDGKKTIIGLGMMELSHIPGLDPTVSSILFIVGGMFAGGGMVHKGLKASDAQDLTPHSEE